MSHCLNIVLSLILNLWKKFPKRFYYKKIIVNDKLPNWISVAQLVYQPNEFYVKLKFMYYVPVISISLKKCFK